MESLFILLIVAFFAVTLALVYGCEKLRGAP